MKKLMTQVSLLAALALPLTASAFVLGPTTPGKWGSPVLGTGASITYSFMPTGTSCAIEFAGCTVAALSDFMPAGYLTQIQAAFSAWSGVANLTFTQVADDGAAVNAATTSGQLRFGGHTFDGPFGVLAHGFYPPNNGNTIAGDMHFDPAEAWKTSFGGAGISIFQVTAHELGHALGLDHTAVSNSLMNPFYTEAFSGPQADDIAGMRFLYGAVPVPEASSWAMMGFGLAAVWMRRRRAS
jgi:hypothetical protein